MVKQVGVQAHSRSQIPIKRQPKLGGCWIRAEPMPLQPQRQFRAKSHIRPCQITYRALRVGANIRWGTSSNETTTDQRYIKRYQKDTKNTRKYIEKHSKAHQKWILNTLQANNGKCSYEKLVEVGEEHQCDTVGAMLKILKNRKLIHFKQNLLSRYRKLLFLCIKSLRNLFL